MIAMHKVCSIVCAVLLCSGCNFPGQANSKSTAIRSLATCMRDSRIEGVVRLGAHATDLCKTFRAMNLLPLPDRWRGVPDIKECLLTRPAQSKDVSNADLCSLNSVMKRAGRVRDPACYEVQPGDPLPKGCEGVATVSNSSPPKQSSECRRQVLKTVKANLPDQKYVEGANGTCWIIGPHGQATAQGDGCGCPS